MLFDEVLWHPLKEMGAVRQTLFRKPPSMAELHSIPQVVQFNQELNLWRPRHLTLIRGKRFAELRMASSGFLMKLAIVELLFTQLTKYSAFGNPKTNCRNHPGVGKMPGPTADISR
jgi:hypothetical protein